MSVRSRLNRLFAADGKCCEVAMDHGVHNESGFLRGIENLGSAVDVVCDGGADAILLSMGQAHLLQDKPGQQKPSLVVRADPTNIYGTPAPSRVFCELVHLAVERAVSLDAAGIVVNLIWAEDQPDVHRQCIANIGRLKSECERFGLPLIAEALLMKRDGATGAYKHNSDVARSVSLVRQAVELGADVIKADPLDDLDEYPKVLEVASDKPLLLRGGSRISDHDLFVRTHAIMSQGAAGVVYGRNVYQHAKPKLMLRACNALVHGGANVEEAEAVLVGTSA